VLAAQLGAAFGEDAPVAAAELVAAAAAELAALRPQDLRAGPFVTTSVTGALGALQARLVPLLAGQVAALATEQLAAQLSQRLAAMEAARGRVLALCEARHDPRPADGLLPGPGGHRFSIGSSQEAVFGAVASHEPALIGRDGSAQPGI
jgi:hypothetical protein